MADTHPLRTAPGDEAAPPIPTADTPLVADAKRLARLLAVGVRTVRSWDAAGKLPTPLRIGGKVVWRLDEIRAWLAAGAPDRETWAARTARR